MNYFAHGIRFLDRPYFLAGTAVPDWLNVVNRKARATVRLAKNWVDDSEPQVAEVARGIIQHHHDDGWFHSSRAFADLNLKLTSSVREVLGDKDDFRPGFLGHILVELLLDAALIEASPWQLDRYYAAIDSLDAQQVSEVVNRMTSAPAKMLDWFILRFSAERFLYDYLDDAKLLWRLNQVMRRVGLEALPERLVALFPDARRQVRARADELLGGGRQL